MTGIRGCGAAAHNAAARRPERTRATAARAHSTPNRRAGGLRGLAPAPARPRRPWLVPPRPTLVFYRSSSCHLRLRRIVRSAHELGPQQRVSLESRTPDDGRRRLPLIIWRARLEGDALL